MKIGNHHHKYIQNIQQQKQTTTKQTNSKPIEKRPEKNVEVNISEEALRLAEISQSEVRSARVEKLKQAIADGTYEIKPKEIVEGIVREINRQKGSED